jgi:hypothetical protein
MGGAKKLTPEQFDRWRREFGLDARSTPMKPSENPENSSPNPLERIAAAGFDRAIPPPHASIPLSHTPIAKVANSGISGAAVVVVVWALKTFVGFEVPPEIASAIAVLLAFISGYLTPLKQRELNA